ncbi:MAG: NUDIX domain-containing protein [Actinomycetota bacterium]|nr:MAG: NUDIX domain-containing protein [Actinomycetota bacterium]
MTLRPRPAVRAMLIDNDLRLLLLKGRDSTVDGSEPWWFTVGGGIHANETPLEAIRREVFEETGRHILEFQRTPFARAFKFIFEGREYFQQEVYFMARTASFDPAARHLTQMESRSIIGSRWWTLNELLHTNETIYPSQLASWLEFLIKSFQITP